MTTTKRLKYIAPLRRDLLPGRPEGLRYLGLENIEAHTGRLLLESEQEAVDSSVVAFDEESVLFGKLRPYLAKVAVPDFTGVGSSEILVFQPRPATDRRFLYYALLAQDFVSRVSALVDGAKMPRAEPAGVANLALYAPPLPEQRRIANYLDEQTAKIDRLIELRRRQVELLAEQRAALIQQAVTKGLDPSVPMKDSGLPWLGEIPAHWEWEKLARAFRLIGSGTTPASGSADYYGGSTPWVTTAELREAPISSTNASVTELALERHSSLKVYPPGTLLVAMYGATIGRLGWLDVAAACNQACCAFAHPKGFLLQYVIYWFMSARETIVSLASGGGQPNMNQDKLRALQVPKPPLDEQERVVRYLDQLSMGFDAIQTRCDRHIALLTEYRAALINECVTGQRRVGEDSALPTAAGRA